MRTLRSQLSQILKAALASKLCDEVTQGCENEDFSKSQTRQFCEYRTLQGYNRMLSIPTCIDFLLRIFNMAGGAFSKIEK